MEGGGLSRARAPGHRAGSLGRSQPLFWVPLGTRTWGQALPAHAAPASGERVNVEGRRSIPLPPEVSGPGGGGPPGPGPPQPAKQPAHRAPAPRVLGPARESPSCLRCSGSEVSLRDQAGRMARERASGLGPVHGSRGCRGVGASESGLTRRSGRGSWEAGRSGLPSPVLPEYFWRSGAGEGKGPGQESSLGPPLPTPPSGLGSPGVK